MKVNATITAIIAVNQVLLNYENKEKIDEIITKYPKKLILNKYFNNNYLLKYITY